MSGWVDGWMDGQVDGWMDGQVGGRMGWDEDLSYFRNSNVCSVPDWVSPSACVWYLLLAVVNPQGQIPSRSFLHQTLLF